MVMKDLIERVRYPDQVSMGFDERIPYDEVVEGLKIGISSNKNNLKTDLKDTLDELNRIWTKRQRQLSQ